MPGWCQRARDYDDRRVQREGAERDALYYDSRFNNGIIEDFVNPPRNRHDRHH